MECINLNTLTILCKCDMIFMILPDKSDIIIKNSKGKTIKKSERSTKDVT